MDIEKLIPENPVSATEMDHIPLAQALADAERILQEYAEDCRRMAE